MGGATSVRLVGTVFGRAEEKKVKQKLARGVSTHMSEAERNRRNLNPHKLAVIAMVWWGQEYAAQGGGSMDFWDKLDKSRKQLCREVLDRINKAPECKLSA
jgi:hypothetical protein